jgi:predicted ABC-type sugar transport system permease subunit
MDNIAGIWLERLSIVVELLSFFLAAPEILEEKRLKSIERWLVQKIAQGAPGMITYISMLLAIAMALGVLGIVLELLHTSPDMVLPPFAQVAIPIFVLLCMLFGAVLGNLVTSKVLIPRLQRLAEDERGRRRWLVLGAILFVASKSMQLSATFLL